MADDRVANWEHRINRHANELHRKVNALLTLQAGIMSKVPTQKTLDRVTTHYKLEQA